MFCEQFGVHLFLGGVLHIWATVAVVCQIFKFVDTIIQHTHRKEDKIKALLVGMGLPLFKGRAC